MCDHVALTPPGAPMTATRTPLADRLAHEAPLAELAVLARAHDAARHTEALLELEAPSGVAAAELHRAAKALRKAIAARIAEVAITAAEVRG